MAHKGDGDDKAEFDTAAVAAAAPKTSKNLSESSAKRRGLLHVGWLRLTVSVWKKVA